MRTLVALATAIAILAAGPASAAEDDEGAWTLRAAADGARLRLQLQWGDGSTWNRVLEESAFTGLAGASAGAAPGGFRIEEDAGTFAFTGAYRDGRGGGRFRFHPRREFGATLRALGIEGAARVSDRDLMNLAFGGLSTADIQAFRALGVPVRTMREVMNLAVQQVSPEYVRALQESGATGANTVEAVVAARMFGVTPELVRTLATVGIRGLPLAEYVDLRRSGVSAAFVREVRAAGHTRATPDELIELRRAARARRAAPGRGG
ncbi:MAG TPA: hypothetical protein VHG93_21915 [Longimicrobium sp.]|nr:hypothetical protein [Longimicrobium sp.]